VPRPFGFEQETERADHLQPGLLGHSPCGTLVNENCIGADFDRESDRLALAVTKASSRDKWGPLGWKAPSPSPRRGGQGLKARSREQPQAESRWNGEQLEPSRGAVYVQVRSTGWSSRRLALRES
jgi:hypothetical protein